ncbi:MAG: hypothetical protein ACI97A_002832, partial [Planctomycetota bacterium]
NLGEVEAFTDSRYEIVQEVVSKEHFNRLLPIHQHMLVTIMEKAKRGESLECAFCWNGSAGDQETIDAFNAAISLGQSGNSEFQPFFRWGSTATPGTGNSQGEATILTYSFVADGTTIPTGGFGDPVAPSDLFSWANGLYGSAAVWQQIIKEEFDRWGALTGVTYVLETNDDGVPIGSSSGVLGVRGDIRIGAKFIDGNSNTLAYNYFPNNGDMVIESFDSFFNDTSNASRKFRNVLTHEMGHGLGMEHVCPADDTKLMEPFITTTFLGPQHDDIQLGQRFYGDINEPNGTFGQATALGTLPLGVMTIDTVSTDDNTDKDFYKFTVTEARELDLTLTPVGLTYDQGPQTMACNTGVSFNSEAVSNLNLRILDTNGTTILLTVNANPAGIEEEIVDFLLPAAGTYYVRVAADSTNSVQMYELKIKLDTAPIAPDFTFVGDSAGDEFGRSARGCGDVNGDGSDDIIVGAWQDDNNGADSGSARVFSGFDGSLLYTFNGDSADDNFGRSVSGAGDVNNDGRADLIVGAWHDDNNGADSGSARVFSGLDGSILFTFDGPGASSSFGQSVASAGDVNADGFDDVVVGGHLDDSSSLNAGIARVFSGFDGSILYTFTGAASGDKAGRSVNGAGDVNNDGFEDVIVGSHHNDMNGSNAGSVRVFSGQDGSTLFTFFGSAANDQFGFSVDGAGDVNIDGYDDVIISSHLDDNNGADSGSIVVKSGLDGSTIYALDGDGAGDQFGLAVAGAGDLNGDGIGDFVVGSHFEDRRGIDSGVARTYSGADGSVIASYDGATAGDELGFFVGAAGDVNGDGFDDLVLSKPFDDENGTEAGSVQVFVSPTLPVLSYSSDLADTRLLATWIPDGGDINSNTGTITCTRATPGGLGIFGLSFAPANILIFGFPLLVANDPINLIDSGGFGYSFAGDLVVPGVSRVSPFIAGSFVHIQFFEESPIISASNGIRLLMVP